MKKFTTTIDTINGTFEFNDTNIPNSGTTVLNQFNAKRTIHSFVMNNNVQTEIYIPFHAINYLHSTADIEEDIPKMDTNCEDADEYCSFFEMYEVPQEGEPGPIEDGHVFNDYHANLMFDNAKTGQAIVPTVTCSDSNIIWHTTTVGDIDCINISLVDFSVPVDTDVTFEYNGCTHSVHIVYP